MKVEFLTPYSDNDLERNSNLRQYVLSKGYVLNILGKNPYQDDDILTRRILENSRVVYAYIYTRGHSLNKKYNELMLNCTKKGRKILKQVLTSQFLADVEVGYNDLGKQTPINFTNFQNIDRNTIIENILCVEAQAILENSRGDLGGYNLLAQQKYYIPELEKVIEDYDSENE